MSKIFIITVQIEQDGWDYKKGDYINVPVESNHKGNAMARFENKCEGSEYPTYSVVNCIECDNFLFKPMLKNISQKQPKFNPIKFP
jgi:hypothetical protein